jgi:hypothetical protein
MLDFGILPCLVSFFMKKRASETNLAVSEREKGSGIQWFKNIKRFLKPFILNTEKFAKAILKSKNPLYY